MSQELTSSSQNNENQRLNIDIKALQQLIQQGRLEEATTLANRYLQHDLDDSQFIEVSYILAVGLRLQKQHDDAISTLHNLLNKQAEHARAQQELGYNFRALNQDKQASIHFYQATKLNPALVSAWQALLPLYKQAKNFEAATLCEQQIRQLTTLPKSILAATDLLHEGKVEAADQLCRRYLQENKHSLDGLMLLAEIALRLKATSEAEFILETCVELAPEHLEAKYQLFKIYSKLGKFAKALALGEHLYKANKDNIFYAVSKATALVGVGRIDEAISIYKHIIKHQRAESNVYLLLGHAQKTAGNIQASVDAYQRAYDCDKYCGDAYWSLANTKTYSFSEIEVTNMLQGTKASTVNVMNKVHLHFALGKAFEDKGDYARSFEHYDKGNRLQRKELDYSSAKHEAFVDTQIATFTPELLSTLQAKSPELGYDDPAPIFILGMPRAGSTLIEQILASHSEVDGTMELHEILGLAANLSKRRGDSPVYPKNLADIPAHYFAEFGKKFIEDTKVYRSGAAYFIDKMPNNYLHIGLIKLILPEAKIIDARRDPMACCFSGFKQLFGEGQEFSYSLSDIGLYYDNYVRLMAHWHTVFPEQILQVNHADMVNNTEHEIRRLLDFCGLEFQQSCVDFHTNKRAVKTPSAQQVRQPIYKSGLDQWKHFESYLDELRHSLGEHD